MLSFLASMLLGLLRFLNQMLPSSPVHEYIQAAQGMEMGLGWLNWFVPISTLLAITGAWLAGILVWYAVDVVVGRVIKAAESGVNI